MTNFNKITQFWQELKRRKVFRVIAMYAATAFIIMEAGEIMLPRLGLPDWTVTFIIILLIIGFPITVILSWIFDITPEGVKKTESIEVAKEQEPSSEPVKRKLRVSDVVIAILVVVVVILAYPKIFKKGEVIELEKSIAVLPFINDSPDDENIYFINGIMEEILNNLQKIKDIRVISRTSVEQYRGPGKSTIPEIAKELDVNYIVEGSGQKYGNTFRLRVQLLVVTAKEKHLWGESYEQEIEETKDIFGIQSQIAQSIAVELKTIITPEEKQLIEKTPTANLTAYDFFLKGIQGYYDYWEKGDIDLVHKSINHFMKAIELDPKYSLAYTGLGRAYWMLGHYAPKKSPYHWKESKRLLKKAMLLDPENGWAYSELGVVQNNWDWDSTASRRSFEKALDLAPNDQNVYVHYIHLEARLGNCNKLASLIKEYKKKFYPDVDIGLSYFNLKLLSCRGEFEQITKIADQDWDRNTNTLQTGYIANAYALTGNYNKALEISEYMINTFDASIYRLSIKGMILAMMGDREGANAIINQLKSLSESRTVSPVDIATIYLALGEIQKTQEYLEQALKQRDLLLHEIGNIPSFYLHKDEEWLKDIIRRSWVPLDDTE